MFLRSLAAERCSSVNSIPDCNHLFVLELLGIILCMRDGEFAALKIVFGHNKSEHAPASGMPAHWTLINRISDAARLVCLPFLPLTKIGRLGMESFFES